MGIVNVPEENEKKNNCLCRKKIIKQDVEKNQVFLKNDIIFSGISFVKWQYTT